MRRKAACSLQWWQKRKGSRPPDLAQLTNDKASGNRGIVDRVHREERSMPVALIGHDGGL